jgi:glutathione synthase/RimK-type ligase-like ATP-grasp enzyme
MILLCGIPSETPLALVRQRLEQRHEAYVCFSQRQFARMDLAFDIADGEVTGVLTIGDDSYPLEYFTGVYTRLMDDQNLPELRREPPDSPLRRRARALHDALMRWYEIAPVRVVNRTAPMGSNFSKPYQSQPIVGQGFRTPETLITNDPDLVREFHATHKKVIYKSMSGVRSIVQTMNDEDLARLDHVRTCPVQFQAFVEGRNVRVHTIGGNVFATAITTDATDYRYAHKQGEDYAELEAIELPDDLSERCLRLSDALDLAFAGIDLKITPDGEVYCFEVNPSPAYSYYENSTGQPISEALAGYLAG